jgi:hypothetical protein
MPKVRAASGAPRSLPPLLLMPLLQQYRRNETAAVATTVTATSTAAAAAVIGVVVAAPVVRGACDKAHSAAKRHMVTSEKAATRTCHHRPVRAWRPQRAPPHGTRSLRADCAVAWRAGCTQRVRARGDC